MFTLSSSYAGFFLCFERNKTRTYSELPVHSSIATAHQSVYRGPGSVFKLGEQSLPLPTGGGVWGGGIAPRIFLNFTSRNGAVLWCILGVIFYSSGACCSAHT